MNGVHTLFSTVTPHIQTEGMEPDNSTDPPTEGEIVKGAIPSTVILCLIGFLGLVGNITMLILIIRYPSLRTIPNLLIINLTLGDLLYISVSFPAIALHEIFPYYAGTEMSCKATNYIQIVGMGVCVYSITGLSIERYIAIVKGLEMRSSRTTRRAVLCIVAIWTVSLIIPIPIIIMAYVPPNMVICYYLDFWTVEAKAYETCRFVLMYIFPFFTIIILYSLISKQLLFSPGETSTRNPLFKARRRLAITVMVVAIFFGISWLPYFTFKLWLQFGFWNSVDPDTGELEKSWDILRVAHTYTSYLNPCLNPWILFFISTTHRRLLLRCFCCSSEAKDDEYSWRMTQLQRNSTRKTGSSVIHNDGWSKDNHKFSESVA